MAVAMQFSLLLFMRQAGLELFFWRLNYNKYGTEICQLFYSALLFD
jgi:hypothetical protein